MNPFYNPFYGQRRAQRAPPRRTPAKQKKGPSVRKPAGTNVTYSDRKLLKLNASTPIQLSASLEEVLGKQSKQAQNWWSEFMVQSLSFRIVKVNDAKENIVFDHFVNSDGSIAASNEEFLREQGRKTKVYVPTHTGMLNIGKCAPKYDATGSNNQFTRVNKLDVLNGLGVSWHGVALMSDVACTIELEQTMQVTFYGAH